MVIPWSVKLDRFGTERVRRRMLTFGFGMKICKRDGEGRRPIYPKE